MKSDHSQLPMQKKMRLEENIFKFLRNIFIRLQKESRFLPKIAPFQLPLFMQATLEREYLCPTIPSIDILSQGELRV